MVTFTPFIFLVFLGVCQRVNSQGATLAELLAGTGAVQPVGPQSQYVPQDNQAQGIDGEDPDIDKLIDSVFNNNKVTTERTKQPVVSVTPNINTGGNGDCECVPFYLCKNNTIVQDGEGLLDIRMKDGPCSSYFEVCCALPNKVEMPLITQKPPTVLRTCGLRNPDGVGFRITGDKDSEAQFGEFPWMTVILREEGLNGNKINLFQCGGSLIHPQAVLTAAHCVADKTKQSSLKVRVGEWDTQTKNEILPHQDREVEEVIIHPQYYAGALFNDIAILFLKSPVDLADNVDVVCLPEVTGVIDHTKCFASGWGKDVFGQEGHYQVILKKIELPIVSRDECLNSLRETRLGKHFILDKSFICAGGENGKDTCKGDGGSPLVCPIPGQPNRFQQAGIVSWGIGCGETNTPGVYSNVAMFRHWIDEQMVYRNLDKSKYAY